MATASFSKEDLQGLVSEGDDSKLTSVSDTITGTSRWSVNHSLVFKEKATGKFYKVHYSEGATEQQDERPFEYDGDAITCTEVLPVERTVIVYVTTP